jgi:IS30 family transposase
MSHKHIGPEDWPVIARMLRAGYSGSEIARTINKDPSAVNRHIRAYGGTEHYDAREVRRRKKQKRIIAMEGTRILKGPLLRRVKQLLKQHYSPEQIAGTLKQQGKRVDSSTIYRYIHERAPHLKQYLRSQKGRYRRRRGTKIREKAREQAKKRRIDERSAVIERRGRIGDWEGDTMLGRDKRVRIVTFVDRRTGYLVAFLLPKLRAELLTQLAVQKFRRIPKAKRKTMTFDNGTEFSDWERFEKLTGMFVYFAYPYHSWERGTNENTNGLLRQYFPKDLDFNTITPQELSAVVRRLNHRPRKRHNFKFPHQLFWK